MRREGWTGAATVKWRQAWQRTSRGRGRMRTESESAPGEEIIHTMSHVCELVKCSETVSYSITSSL